MIQTSRARFLLRG